MKQLVQLYKDRYLVTIQFLNIIWIRFDQINSFGIFFPFGFLVIDLTFIINQSKRMNLFTSLIGNQQQEQPVPKKRQKSTDFFFCFHAKEYFDIEEEDIFARIKSAIILRPAFSEVIGDKPDLYGPFWIANTLIVVIIAASSLVHFFYADSSSTFDFNQISVASSLIYGIAFGCPYIIAILVKIFGGLVSVVDVKVKAIQLMCVYGYSLTMFLPVTAFCFIKSAMIQTILLFLAFIFSTAFLIRGILSLDANLGQKQRGVLGVFIIGVQAILIFMYKFYFFDLI